MDSDWIELSHLSINHNQFGSDQIMVDFTHIFAIIQLKKLYFTYTQQKF